MKEGREGGGGLLAKQRFRTCSFCRAISVHIKLVPDEVELSKNQ
jgi:hypothetical protein